MPDRPLVHLVVPRWGGTGVHLTFGHRMPPMSALVLAAHARRAGWEVAVFDHNYQRIPMIDGPGRSPLSGKVDARRPDLAAITTWTSTAAQSYHLADAYRAQGVPVALGGVHASLLPTEALRHADTVVCGEADSIFGQVLADAAAGRLQPLYQGEWKGMDAVPLNHEWADLYKQWPITRYAPMNTLQTTRGCRFNCDFCSVIRINGRGARHSPPERVIEEVKVLKRFGQGMGDRTYVFLLDDDLAADLDYAAELSETILASGEKFTWGAQASIGLCRNPEILDLVTRAGCRAVFTGFESMSRDSLIECNKKNRPGEFGELIEKAHRKGLAIEGGFIFGFDTDKPDVFQMTAEFVDLIGVDVAHFATLTPYPGTQTYARMYEDGRITCHDWKKYNLYNVVFEPAQMTAQQLQDGLHHVYDWFYSRRRRWARARREMWRRDPLFSGAFAAANVNYGKRYRFEMTPEPGYVARPEDLATLLKASSVPANDALNVAYANAVPNVSFLPRKPATV